MRLGLEPTWLAARLPPPHELLVGCIVTAHNSDRWKRGTFRERVRVTLLQQSSWKYPEAF